MHAAILLMTSAWLAGADPAPVPAAAPAPAPPAAAACGSCCGGGCGSCADACCEKEGFLKKCFKKFHKNDCCCETPCCGAASITAASCCDTCCEKESCFKKWFKKHHKDDCCCETTCAKPACCAPAPTCCAPAPTCCQPACDCCEKESCFKRWFKKHRHKDECCDTCNTCNSCGAPVAAPAKGPEPIGPPKDPKKMPEGAAIVPMNPDAAAAPRIETAKPVVTSEVPF